MLVTVNVYLMSGRSVTLESDETAELDHLKKRAERALGVAQGRLVSPSGVILDGAATIKKALLTGDVMTLHSAQVQVLATKATAFAHGAAFAAILGDSSVVTWGHDDYGGNSRHVQARLRSVRHLQSCSLVAQWYGILFPVFLVQGSLIK